MTGWLGGLYRTVLRLFPRAFREEFGEEMEAVFAQAMQEAAGQGRFALLRAAAAEIGGLLFERVCQSARSARARLAVKARPAAPQEALLGLAVFVVPVLALAVEGDASPLAYQGITLLLVGLLLAGVLGGMPRWSLPGLGLSAASGAFVWLFQWGADRLSPHALARFGIFPTDESSRLLFQAAWAGLAWLMLFVVIGAALGLLAWMGRFQSLVDDLRQDWTLASYTLYGGALAALVLAPALAGVPHPPQQRIYLLLAVAGMALGSWLYLTAEGSLRRWLALLAGLSLALPACAAGGLPLLPVLDGAGLGERKPLVEWFFMAAVMLSPVLLRILPGAGRDSDRQAA